MGPHRTLNIGWPRNWRVGIRMRKSQTESSEENPAMIFSTVIHPLMAQISAEEVANGVGLAADKLSKPCDNSIIPSLADCFSQWKVIFSSLLSDLRRPR